MATCGSIPIGTRCAAIRALKICQIVRAERKSGRIGSPEVWIANARSPALVSSRSKFLFEQSIQVLGDRRMIEALDHFVQKTGDEEALGDFRWNPARA